MSLDADKIASLGLTLAVLREAFNSSDSAERVANMDVPSVTRSVVEEFDLIRAGIVTLKIDLDSERLLRKKLSVRVHELSDENKDLKGALIKAQERIASLRHVGLELTGAIEEYSAMPCDSLLKRMIGSVDRYKPRLSTVLEPCAPDVCETCNGTKLVDGESILFSSGGIPFENGPVECVKDCPSCAPPESGELAIMHRWSAERDALNTLLGYASEALKFTGLQDHLVDFEFVESVKAAIDLRLQGQGHEELPVTAQNKYDVVLKPFTRLMERELHANSSKGDRPAWLKMTAGECLLEIYYHAGKLHKAVHGSQGDDILEYAADVANLSMMLTDIVGALGLFAHDEAANAKG